MFGVITGLLIVHTAWDNADDRYHDAGQISSPVLATPIDIFIS